MNEKSDVVTPKMKEIKNLIFVETSEIGETSVHDSQNSELVDKE